MKIKTTVDLLGVDVEVDCDISDVISELVDRADAADKDHWRAVTPAIDALSRIMLRMSDDMIRGMPCGVQETIRERLSGEVARYDRIISEAATKLEKGG